MKPKDTITNQLAIYQAKSGAYDKDQLEVKNLTKKQATITAKELESALGELKHSLLEKGEPTDLFGAERSTGAIAGFY